jgi:hypothetical protein
VRPKPTKEAKEAAMSLLGQGLRWFRDPERYAKDMKVFHALIGNPKASDAKRVSTEAHNLKEAKKQLEAEFGVGSVLSLWVDTEWQLPRGKC